MARLSRLAVPGHPHHLFQRGNDRAALFRDDEDRACYLGCLREAALAARVALHAYVLMEDHVHLLATPAGAEGLSRMMQALGRNYVGRFTDEADTTVFGSFELEIDELGVVEGSGLLNGRDVDIRGILQGDEIDGYIDDTLIHTTGSFTGRRSVSGYIGEFDLDQGPQASDFFGYWDCVLDE